MSTRIDTLEQFDINGAPQWVLLRGNPAAKRVLLIVQMGPGFPAIHEARDLERELHAEANAVVAYWDQRGTGRSLDIDPSTLDVAHLVADVRAVVDALCTRLGVDRVDILGFSIGATYALMAAATDPSRIGHIVAVGIDVDLGEAERYAYEFARAEAVRRGNRRAQRQLEAIGEPPHDTGAKFSTRVRWVTNYGGIHRGLGFLGLMWTFVRRLLRSPHYSTRQAIAALRAVEPTQNRVLADLAGFDLRAVVSKVDVPIAFFQGRRDAGTPPALVASYADALAAPRGKSFVWFENSAHLPHFEEPARFADELRRALA